MAKSTLLLIAFLLFLVNSSLLISISFIETKNVNQNLITRIQKRQSNQEEQQTAQQTTDEFNEQEQKQEPDDQPKNAVANEQQEQANTQQQPEVVAGTDQLQPQPQQATSEQPNETVTGQPNSETSEQQQAPAQQPEIEGTQEQASLATGPIGTEQPEATSAVDQAASYSEEQANEEGQEESQEPVQQSESASNEQQQVVLPQPEVPTTDAGQRQVSTQQPAVVTSEQPQQIVTQQQEAATSAEQQVPPQQQQPESTTGEQLVIPPKPETATSVDQQQATTPQPDTATSVDQQQATTPQPEVEANGQQAPMEQSNEVKQQEHVEQPVPVPVPATDKQQEAASQQPEVPANEVKQEGPVQQQSNEPNGTFQQQQQVTPAPTPTQQETTGREKSVESTPSVLPTVAGGAIGGLISAADFPQELTSKISNATLDKQMELINEKLFGKNCSEKFDLKLAPLINNKLKDQIMEVSSMPIELINLIGTKESSVKYVNGSYKEEGEDQSYNLRFYKHLSNQKLRSKWRHYPRIALDDIPLKPLLKYHSKNNLVTEQQNKLSSKCQKFKLEQGDFYLELMNLKVMLEFEVKMKRSTSSSSSSSNSDSTSIRLKDFQVLELFLNHQLTYQQRQHQKQKRQLREALSFHQPTMQVIHQQNNYFKKNNWLLNVYGNWLRHEYTSSIKSLFANGTEKGNSIIIDQLNESCLIN